MDEVFSGKQQKRYAPEIMKEIPNKWRFEFSANSSQLTLFDAIFFRQIA